MAMSKRLDRNRPGTPRIFSNEHILTPAGATALFVVACLAGYRYRRVWKSEGPRWQLWLFGGIAAAGLLILAFVPLSAPGGP